MIFKIQQLQYFCYRGQRGNAVGFKLSSLTRIADTKSSCNKNMTLLHYIADTCQQKVYTKKNTLLNIRQNDHNFNKYRLFTFVVAHFSFVIVYCSKWIFRTSKMQQKSSKYIATNSAMFGGETLTMVYSMSIITRL